jgi:hypothetical protein
MQTIENREPNKEDAIQQGWHSSTADRSGANPDTPQLLLTNQNQTTMNELIKERNELAKQLFIHHPNSMTPDDAIKLSTELVGLMYQVEETESEQPESTTATPVSIHRDKNGNPDGVQVQTLDECFVLELHDIDNGKDNFSYNTAQERLKELGKDTVNRKQALILLTYIEEINKALVEAGGDAIAKDGYVTNELYKPVGCADYYGDYSWFFGGLSGCFYNDGRYLGICRCRPVLA